MVIEFTNFGFASSTVSICLHKSSIVTVVFPFPCLNLLLPLPITFNAVNKEPRREAAGVDVCFSMEQKCDVIE